MIVPDANLLIYAVNKSAPLHRQAKTWLEETFSGPEPIGLPWNVVLAFLRITTRQGPLRHPLSLPQAFNIVDAWLEQPAVTVIHPGSRHARLLRELLEPLGTGGNLTSDAHLAAIAIEHGAELCSSDSDFARFARASLEKSSGTMMGFSGQSAARPAP